MVSWKKMLRWDAQICSGPIWARITTVPGAPQKLSDFFKKIQIPIRILIFVGTTTVVIRAQVGPEHIWASHLSIFFQLSIVIWAFFYNWAFLSEHDFPAEHFHLSIIFELSISIWAFFVIWASKSAHVLSSEHFYLNISCHLSIFIWAFFLPSEHFNLSISLLVMP